MNYIRTGIKSASNLIFNAISANYGDKQMSPLSNTHVRSDRYLGLLKANLTAFQVSRRK